MKIPVSKAAKTWGVSRNTIYEKHRRGELSMVKGEGIDPAEMSRVFGNPKTTGTLSDTGKLNKSGHIENALLEQKIAFLEQQAKEYKEQAQREKELAQQERERANELYHENKRLIDRVLLLEAPKSEPKTEKKGFLSRFF